MSDHLPPAVAARVHSYLEEVDAALPGAVEGLYVVGSVALGAFRPGRSDIDFLAVLGRSLHDGELAVLRSIAHRRHRRAVVEAALRRRWPLVANGCFVPWAALEGPAIEAPVVAAHVAGEFSIGEGFDVNPVTWRILATRGIAVRGPAATTLPVVSDDDELREWNRENLGGYWRGWAASMRRANLARTRARLMHVAATWGSLGAPRLHATIATGAILTKEQAGEYAKDAFDAAWHPLLDRALAYWRGSRRALAIAPARQLRETADFVDMVIDSAA